MNKATLVTLASVNLFTLCCPQVWAEQQPSLQQLKDELSLLKQEYQNKIQQLELRLAQAEQSVQHNLDDIEQTQTSVEQLAVELSQQANQTAANTFNPGIGMILNARYASYHDNFSYQIPGFLLGEEAGPGEQGFQLGESELNLSANVDDKFYASATLAFGDGEANVEEAYIQTLGLANGFNIKAGRFFSGIGYLASKHRHSDDFANRPLPYEAFLAGQFGDAGIQATWLAPTELYWESGAEWYRGDSFPAAGSANSGKGLWTAFTHVGGDIGQAHNWRAGLSYLQADVAEREFENGAQFSGTSKLWLADIVYRWSPSGNRTDQEFKLQGEYLSRTEHGLFNDQTLADANLHHDQSGWYLEAVYKFSRQWRVGVRSSALHSSQLPTQFDGSILDRLNHRPTQQSLMLDWSNSEFSRIRLQYDANDLDGTANNVWLLQYIAAFGAHGAHSY
jgi:hypothetical protein